MSLLSLIPQKIAELRSFMAGPSTPVRAGAALLRDVVAPQVGRTLFPTKAEADPTTMKGARGLTALMIPPILITQGMKGALAAVEPGQKPSQMQLLKGAYKGVTEGAPTFGESLTRVLDIKDPKMANLMAGIGTVAEFETLMGGQGFSTLYKTGVKALSGLSKTKAGTYVMGQLSSANKIADKVIDEGGVFTSDNVAQLKTLEKSLSKSKFSTVRNIVLQRARRGAGISKPLLTHQPAAGGLPMKEVPPIIKKKLAQGINIVKRDAPIRMTKDIVVKDVAGAKVTLPRGEEYTPFVLSNNQVWLHDGKNILVNKNEMNRVEQEGLALGEKELYTPEEKQVEEVWKGGEGKTVPTGGAHPGGFPVERYERGTKFSRYQIPGGKNYRELVVTAPDINEEITNKFFAQLEQKYGVTGLADDSMPALQMKEFSTLKLTPEEQSKWIELTGKGVRERFKSTHFEESNPLYHVRLNDRYVTPESKLAELKSKGFTPKEIEDFYSVHVSERAKDQKKVLFIEEVQSDWAKEVREKIPEYSIEHMASGNYAIFENEVRIQRLYDTRQEALAALNKLQAKVTSSHPLLKNWHEHAAKKIVEIAKREGYDGISWITGEQTAERYYLSKQVTRIDYTKVVSEDEQGKEILEEAKYLVRIVPKGDADYINKTVSQKELPDLVGKDLAEKMSKEEGESIKFRDFDTSVMLSGNTLKGQDLKIGGEWAKNLYGKMLPKALAKASRGSLTSINMDVEVPAFVRGTLTSDELSTYKAGGKLTQPAIMLPKLQPMAGGLPQSAEEPVQKVIEALKSAKDVRKKQETLYSKERGKKLAKMLAVGKRTKGERGFFAEKGALRGELPKVEFESIRDKLSQEDIDSLFDAIKNSPAIPNPWQKFGARGGLAKLFGEAGGKVPTRGELKMLGKVFPAEFLRAILDKRAFSEKLMEGIAQAFNIPRSVMSSFDLSYGFRQGLFAIPQFRRQFFDSFKKQFRWFASEKAFKASQAEIQSRPTFELMNDAHVSFTEMDSLMSEREEIFMSQWAEKIPGLGRVIRASGRAYTAFANKLRADMFDELLRRSKEQGLDIAENKDLLKQLGEFINAATGRGPLPGGMERIAPLLSGFFFSPRLTSSRLTLLNPGYYIKKDPFVRKEALKSLISFIGMGMTVLTAAKLMGGKVGLDPRNADFGKIKIGNTRIDIWGGFQQPVRIFAQIVTGKVVSSTSGRIMTLGEGYKPMTRLDILLRFFEMKESPIASFFTNWMRGRSSIGEKFTVKREIMNRFTPMVAQDVYDLFKENPRLAPLGILPVFGLGLQTYGPRTRREKARAEKWKRMTPKQKRSEERERSYKWHKGEILKNIRELRELGRHEEAAKEVTRLRKLSAGMRLETSPASSRGLQKFLR